MKVRVNAKEANAIPILEVARLVVPRFQDKGHLSTGQCCRHTDEKLGNLRFKVDANFAHCFTCDTTWRPVDLVMDFMSLSFLDALEYLYNHFPSYFTDIDYYDVRPAWNGLSNKEYRYLGIPTQLYFGKLILNIRDFAENFPDEHDSLLIVKVIEKLNEINSLANFLQGRMDSLEINQDQKKIEKKLYTLLHKGLRSKKNESLYKKIVS